MNLLDRGSRFLDRKLGTAGGVAVLYTRGGVTVPVLAVPGAQRADAQQTTPPARIDWTEREYTITVAALLAAGIDGPPAAEDKITETINGIQKMFVLKPRPTEDCWRYTDAGRSCYRLNMKATD